MKDGDQKWHSFRWAGQDRPLRGGFSDLNETELDCHRGYFMPKESETATRQNLEKTEKFSVREAKEKLRNEDQEVGVKWVSIYSTSFCFYHLKLLTPEIPFRIIWRALGNMYITCSPCFCFFSHKFFYTF